MSGSGIQAETVVPAPREEVFAYLARLDNHWRLTDDRVEVVSLDHPDGAPSGEFDGGMVRICGPLGLGRTAQTRVESAEPPASMSGTARIGSRTLAHVSWSLSPDGEGATRVRLAAQVESASPLDRLLLTLGGRAWMRGMFVHALDRLRDQFS
jgi:uncharacterized protein YndB with AHSA1/START domain